MKINGIETTSITKINGIAIGSITKIDGVILPSSPTLPSPTNAFDAGNVSSYPGGNTWYNISGSSNVTLFNGVAYNGDGGGCLTFNGANQYGIAPYNSTFNFSTGIFLLIEISVKTAFQTEFKRAEVCSRLASLILFSKNGSTALLNFPK
jgi:hypothetical protein